MHLARLIRPLPSGLVAVMVALLSLLPPGRSPAFAAGAAWEESAGLRCLVDDAVDAGARIFESPDYQKTLVVPTAGDEAWVFFLKAEGVQSLAKTAIAWSDHQLPTPDLSGAVDAGLFVKQEGKMIFIGDAATVTLEPEPPLVGPLALTDFKTRKPDYVHAQGLYAPDAKAIAALKAVTGETKVVVFFGSWCSHCKHWVPGFLKTLEAASNPRLKAEFYGVSEDLTEPADAMRLYGASKTPTFIVLQAGKELGRIEEEPEVSIEADLARILTGR